MKAIDLAIDLVGKLRKEKQPPLARYAIILVLARKNRPMTAHQIAQELREPSAMDSAMRSCVGLELVVMNPLYGTRHYSLTPKGQRMAMDLLKPSVKRAISNT